MSKQIKIQCLKSMLYLQKHTFLLEEGDPKRCWEQVALDADHLLHICIDCLMYVSQQEDSVVGDKEFIAIMAKREAVGIRKYECNIHSLSC